LRKPVSSLRLWDKLPQVDRPRARLRRPPLSILLLLQLLLLAAGAIALIRPGLETPVGRRYVLLLDASGSMTAASNGATRFEQAKAEARKVASELRSQDLITLVRVGSSVTTACSNCDHTSLERALSALNAGAGEADMPAALSLASGLTGRAETHEDAVQTIIISDGGFSPTTQTGNSKFIKVGEPVSNHAVTTLSARRPPDGRPNYVAYARVDNNSSSEATLQVAALADTVPLPERAVTLAAGGHADLTWQLPAGTARFTVSINGRDAISEDDKAVIFLPSASHHKVVITSPQAALYRRAVEGIEGLEPVVVTTNTLASTAGSLAFTIIEGRVPPALPLGSLLLVNPSGDLFPSKGDVNGVRPVSGGTAHTIMSGLDLAPLLVRKAPQVETPSWLEPVVWSEAGTPLIAAGELEGRRVAALLFNPNDSNLPKLASFPLLMANLADWLYPLAGAGALRPGDPIYFTPGTAITTPGGAQVQVGPSGVFNYTEQAGIYKVAGDAFQQDQFSVNMASLTESTTSLADHPELQNPQSAIQDPKSEIGEVWSPFAFFALILVGTEWLFYCWKRGRM
jgi:Ca-activated chloride channel family protein